MNILLAIQAAAPADNYAAQRKAAAEAAAEVVKAMFAINVYPMAYSFPGWKEPNEMLDFGALLAWIDVASPSTACFYLFPQPLSTGWDDDVFEHSDQEQLNKIQKIISYVSLLPEILLPSRIMIVMNTDVSIDKPARAASAGAWQELWKKWLKAPWGGCAVYEPPV